MNILSTRRTVGTARTQRTTTLRLIDTVTAAGAVIPFAVNVNTTAQRVARLLEPELRVCPGWDDSLREAVYIGPIDRRTGSPHGLYLADGEQLVIAADGTITVEQVHHAR